MFLHVFVFSKHLDCVFWVLNYILCPDLCAPRHATGQYQYKCWKKEGNCVTPKRLLPPENLLSKQSLSNPF